MKKIILVLVSLLALTTSCTKHEIETPYSQSVKEATFASDFNSYFGVAAEDYANHDWGMSLIPFIDVASTRSVDVNSNEWEAKGYTIPADITAREIEVVSTWFKTHKDPTSESVNLTDYFVQNVYHSGDVYHAKDMNNADHSITGSDHMDYISVKKSDGTWEHINNFNANSGQIQHLLNSGTASFSFHDSYANYTSQKYVLRYISVDGVVGCYVGFDYETRGSQNGEHYGDGFYSDRIVKIVPSDGSSIIDEIDYVRVMCEDLGVDHSDFDYNDVVFDVKFIKRGNTIVADIVLRAAGGTLPLTIGGIEVHNKFGGYPTTTMINTHSTIGDHVDDVPPVQFEVTLNGEYSNAYQAINALPVVVQLENGQTVHLTTNPGSPAEMFAVPVGTNWPNERQNIKGKYPRFVEWITNSGIKWYE